MKATRLAFLFVTAPLLAATLACSTATPTGTPGVDRIGRTMLRYNAGEVQVVLSYSFANANPGEDWLFIDTAITGNTRESVEVNRGKVAVRIPTGEVIPLAPQKEFGEAYPKLAATLARADIGAEPIDIFSDRRQTGLDFLVVPGTAIALDAVWVNDQNVAIGRLYFDLPNGVQPGSYELRIDLKETKVRIPFTLGGQS